GHLAKHWSAKKFISVLLVVWALFAIGCGLARTYHELLWLRLLLGVAESGVYPATLILLSHWFSRSERARANAFWLLCLPGAVILASPFSGRILELFWLPSAMGKFRMLSSLSTGILYTIPFIVGAISVLVISPHSDMMHERRFHAAGAMLFGGTCILLAVATIPHSLLIAFAFIALSGVGAYGPMGAFWAIPTETLPSKIVGSVMGFVNAIGNLGAYFAPLIVGFLNKRTGSFLAGFTYLGAITLVAAALATLIKAAPATVHVGSRKE